MASEPITSHHVTLRTSDSHPFDAYVSRTTKSPEAAVVIVQEIFGVNAHIRSVADSYAKEGFLAIAPALFDRIEPGVDLGYEGADAQKARSFIPRMDMEKVMFDVNAAVQFAAKSTGKKVGVIGYCLGGTMAIAAA